MKKYLAILAVSTLMFSCKKEELETAKLTVISPNGGETFHAGQLITVKWNTQNVPATTYIAATIVNKTTNTPIVGVRLEPTNSVVVSNIGNVTANDGEETFQVPWRYSHEGFQLYTTIGNSTFTVQLNGGTIDLNNQWNPGNKIIEAVSKNFTVQPSVLPDGCTSTNGYSVTTGQPCH